VIKVTPALQALLDPQDPRAIKVIPDLQARKDLQAHKAHVDQKDREDPKAHRDLKVLQGAMARLIPHSRFSVSSSHCLSHFRYESTKRHAQISQTELASPTALAARARQSALTLPIVQTEQTQLKPSSLHKGKQTGKQGLVVMA
jgi:hypothetical protein